MRSETYNKKAVCKKSKYKYVYTIKRRATLPICAFRSLQSREGVNYALWQLELLSCPELRPPRASGASRCLAPQPGTVYLLRYAPPRTVAQHLQAPAEDSAFPAPVNHRPAPLWLISEFGAVIQIFRLNSTQLNHRILSPTIGYDLCMMKSKRHFEATWKHYKTRHRAIVSHTER